MEDFGRLLSVLLGVALAGLRLGVLSTVEWISQEVKDQMTGSHRASRVSRAAAREARRQQARRRKQLLAAGAAVVVLVGGGGYAALAATGGDGFSGVESSAPDDKPSDDGSVVLADQAALLDGPTVKPLTTAGTWTVARTVDGSGAPDHSFVCQPQRFADPTGIRTWVRTFRNPTTKDTAVQYVEVSNNAAGAGKAYATITGWLSQCSTPQVRLVASYTTKGLGDRGVVAVFGQPAGGRNSRFRTVSVTTSGPATMVLEHDTAGSTPPKPAAILAAANAGLQRICAQAGTTCGKTPTVTSSLLPTTEPPGFMSPIDLPVLSSVTKPWVSVASGTRTGTGCEKIDLRKAKATAYRSQTYVVPDADVPTEFGMDTTVAEFASTSAASAFVSSIRKSIDNCEKTTSNASVERTGTVSFKTVKGQTWRVAYETGGGKIFTYRIGIAAVGKRSIYTLYPVLKSLDISDSAFTEILTRAGERSTTFKK